MTDVLYLVLTAAALVLTAWLIRRQNAPHWHELAGRYPSTNAPAGHAGGVYEIDTWITLLHGRRHVAGAARLTVTDAGLALTSAFGGRRGMVWLPWEALSTWSETTMHIGRRPLQPAARCEVAGGWTLVIPESPAATVYARWRSRQRGDGAAARGGAVVQ